MGLLQNNEPVQAYVVNRLNSNISESVDLAEVAEIDARNAQASADSNKTLIAATKEELTSLISSTAEGIKTIVRNEYIAELQEEIDGEIQTVEHTVASQETEIQQNASAITFLTTQTGNINSDLNEVKGYVQIQGGNLLLGKNTSPVTLLITNDGIYIKSGNNTISYWNTEAQLTPMMLKIPSGGNFEIGNFRFVPRSTGNLSLVYIGD